MPSKIPLSGNCNASQLESAEVGEKIYRSACFFDAPDTHKSDDLKSRPIDLAPLEKQQETGLSGFFEKLGIKGGKSLVFCKI